MRFRYTLLLLSVIAPMTLAAQTKKWDEYRAENGISLPTWNIKTNLLADLTTSLNLAFEFRTGEHTSLDITGQWNPFSFRDGVTKWKHIGAQPEFRYWTAETFRGHFFGVHAHYVFFNVGGLWNGPFTDYMHENRFQGDLYGLGVSWGHRWNFSRGLGLEVTAGVGYAHKNYKRYECGDCGEELGHRRKNYFGPTRLGVSLIFGGDSRQEAVPVPIPVPIPVPVAKVRYEPRFAPSFIVPDVEPVKIRYESGSAYLEFPVGNSTIIPDFRDNTAELARIDKTIRLVKDDPDATITGLTLTGNASPEGSWPSNQSLSQRRAVALKHYLIERYGLQSGLIATHGEGEDWDTLSRLVEESNIVGKQSLLAIINGSDNHDARDRQMIAANRAGYDAMVRDIYPRLRRTDYKLDFEVAPISIERGKEIMRTRPRNLSLNELFLIAETYEPGTEEFREVNEIAARAFPDSDIANNNAAAAALARGDVTSAATFLSKVKHHGAQWNNNMGIVSYMQGDPVRAAGYFRAAGSTGSANVHELEKHLESIR